MDQSLSKVARAPGLTPAPILPLTTPRGQLRFKGAHVPQTMHVVSFVLATAFLTRSLWREISAQHLANVTAARIVAFGAT